MGKPVWYRDQLVAPRPVRDEVDLNDDRIIRMRMAGMSFSDIAIEMTGEHRPGAAMRRYRAARTRQIPLEEMERSLPRPNGLTIAWAAGFFDGEGCVLATESVDAKRILRTRFQIYVAQVTRQPLDDLAAAWGGTVHEIRSRNPRHRDQFRWQIGGRRAGWFLTDILPHLRVKFEVARLATPFLLRTHGKGYPYTEAEIAARREAIAAIQHLNSPMGHGHGRQAEGGQT